MIYFNCDYNEGAHPKVMEMLLNTNMEQTCGYGEDMYCEKARKLIKQKCNNQDVDVHFVVGGTMANITAISAALRPYQGIICSDMGHIHTHETGSIEALGYKILNVQTDDGKLTAKQINNICKMHYQDVNYEHTVQPKMVYISNPTEVGTIYTKNELDQLYCVCREYDLYLYMDGARLGYGLCAKNSDLDLGTIASFCDVFYIGGTKQGALFGEALVISNQSLKKDFRYILKQKGGLLAKGRLLGIQFIALFENDLYFQLAQHANRMALMIKEACMQNDIPLLYDSYTNQQFPVIPNRKIHKINGKYEYILWESVDQKQTAIRICTSWATEEENVNKLIKDLYYL